MSKVIQCVPNFSEGRRADVIRRIADAIGDGGSRVIDLSLDRDHNRSVITFIGSPEQIKASAPSAVKTAVDLIDIRNHTGGHPRIGVVDVIPLVPIKDITMQECVDLSRGIGAVIAEYLRIPVYFYERSTIRKDRWNLSTIRKGGYEALAAGKLDGDREPDLGPHHVHPSAGATVIGARGPLIAFNVDLQSNDLQIAERIASDIRKMRNEGRGMFGVKAIGVELASQGVAQVSTNITEPDKVTMRDVYEYVKRRAAELGVEVRRSELIGVVRRDAALKSPPESIQLEGFTESRILDSWLD